MTTYRSSLSDVQKIGLVVIGRNEGERLKMALNAIKEHHPSNTLVYVDSGSTDGSVDFARSIGASIVELDSRQAFTAARARNAGFNAVLSLQPDVELVQFLDGDCEITATWLEHAISAFAEDPELAVVSGRRMERFPERSIYNALMDVEWNAPPGYTKAVLGDMCFRVDVFQQVKGFSEDVIAAEDDDICIRTRALGYRIMRLSSQMSTHDANILTLWQWFRRSKRGGFAYAAIFDKHRNSGERYFLRELINVLCWAVALPALLLVSLLLAPTVAAVIILLSLLLIAKTVYRRLRNGDPARISLAYGLLIYAGKFPEFAGVLEYLRRRFAAAPVRLIEYK